MNLVVESLTLPIPDGSGRTFVSREYIRVVDPPRLLCYATRETFTGKLARPVLTAQGAWVKAGFDAVALALRDHANTLFTSRPAGG